jgi:hypothetical protein
LLAARKSVENPKQIAEPAPPPEVAPPRTAVAARLKSLIDSFDPIQAYLTYRWCRDVEQRLENGIEFLRQYGDELTDEQREISAKILRISSTNNAEIC